MLRSDGLAYSTVPFSVRSVLVSILFSARRASPIACKTTFRGPLTFASADNAFAFVCLARAQNTSCTPTEI